MISSHNDFSPPKPNFYYWKGTSLSIITYAEVLVPGGLKGGLGGYGGLPPPPGGDNMNIALDNQVRLGWVWFG